MKHSLSLSLSLIFLSAAGGVPLRDTNGAAISPHVKYNITFPTLINNAGGAGNGFLSLGIRNNTCPPTISIRANRRHYRRLAIAVISPNPVTSINVNFTGAPAFSLCGLQSLTWRGAIDTYSNKTFVTTGGQERSLDSSVAGRSWFQFQALKNNGSKDEVYKLAYCPRDCRACIVPCYDVGIVVEGGERWLGISGEALPLQFEKMKKKRSSN